MLSSKQWNNKTSDIKLVYLYSTIQLNNCYGFYFTLRNFHSNWCWSVIFALYWAFTVLIVTAVSSTSISIFFSHLYLSFIINCCDLVWFGVAYLFIRSVTHVTLDTSITDYILCITTQLIIYGHKWDLSLHLDIFVTTSRYMCVCVFI